MANEIVNLLQVIEPVIYYYVTSWRVSFASESVKQQLNIFYHVTLNCLVVLMRVGIKFPLYYFSWVVFFILFLTSVWIWDTYLSSVYFTMKSESPAFFLFFPLAQLLAKWLPSRCGFLFYLIFHLSFWFWLYYYCMMFSLLLSICFSSFWRCSICYYHFFLIFFLTGIFISLATSCFNFIFINLLTEGCFACWHYVGTGTHIWYIWCNLRAHCTCLGK